MIRQHLIATFALLAGVALVACGRDPEPSRPLDVDQVLPREIRNTNESLVLIVGSGFQDGASVTLGGRPLSQVTYVNNALLTAVIPAGLESGGYPVSVTLPDGGTARGDTPVTIVGGNPAQPTATPRPSATPAPTAAPTRAPTATPAPTAAPTPEPTPRPTPTPAPTPAPTPERTPTQAPSPTPAPTRPPAQPPTASPPPTPGQITPTGTPSARDRLQRNLPGAALRGPPGQDDNED